MDKREKFTSKLGFVMACIGSAIGLGNIWMFPYRLGAYGGGSVFDSVFYLCIHSGNNRIDYRVRIWTAF